MSIQGFQFEGDSTLYKYDYNALDNKLELDDTLEDNNKAANAGKVGDELATKANIDGYYEDLTSGNAEQIVSTQYLEDKIPYHFRTSGGSLDIGNREEDMVVGGSIVWNQLSRADLTSKSEIQGITRTASEDGTELTYTGTATLTDNYTAHTVNPTVVDHKVLITLGNVTLPSGARLLYSSADKCTTAIYTVSANATQISVRINRGVEVNFTMKPQFFDLTVMFGTEVADAIYAMEQAEAGAGVAWFKKLFPKDYYEYDAGTLKHVEGVSSHDMVGFNQWDEEWELGTISLQDGIPISSQNAIRSKNYSDCIPRVAYNFGGGSSGITKYFFWYDSLKNYISYSNATSSLAVSPVNARYFRIRQDGRLSYSHDICINISDPSRNGIYEPYVKHTYPLDSSLTLRGIPKIDASGNLYYDGDTYESDGTVTRRYGIVDLGTLNWTTSGNSVFAVQKPSDMKPTPNTQTASFFCGLYFPISGDAASLYTTGVIYLINQSGLRIKDTAYTDAAPFKTAMSGVYLVYELATPTTETADPYQNPQIVDASGTEEYVSTSIVPVGHETKYPANLRDKIQHLPDLASDEGNYIINQQGQKMTLVRFRIPSAPNEDGTYILRATVSNGTPTYTWEAVNEG